MRDGLVIDALVGITIEGMGRNGIAKMRNSLSAEECLALLPKLSELLNEPAWSADLLAREAALADNIYGWKWHLTTTIAELVAYDDVPLKNSEWACNRELAQSRLLLCELAIRAYSLQHGCPPAILANLVPRYLLKVPKIPSTAVISFTA